MSPWSQLRPRPLRLLRKTWPRSQPRYVMVQDSSFYSWEDLSVYDLVQLSLRLTFIPLLSRETLTVLFSAFLLASPDLDSPPPFCGFHGGWLAGAHGWAPDLFADLSLLPFVSPLHLHFQRDETMSLYLTKATLRFTFYSKESPVFLQTNKHCPLS